MHTFFEDFKYLESCTHCVKRLFWPVNFNLTNYELDVCSTVGVWRISSRYRTKYHSDIGVYFSTSASERCGAPRDWLLTDWLYAMRHYTLMPPDPKNKDDLLANAKSILQRYTKLEKSISSQFHIERNRTFSKTGTSSRRSQKVESRVMISAFHKT